MIGNKLIKEDVKLNAKLDLLVGMYVSQVAISLSTPNNIVLKNANAFWIVDINVWQDVKLFPALNAR